MGSRGDVQPYVALGKALQDAGFNVRLATSSNFEPFVAEHGLEFRQVIDFDLVTFMQQDDVKALLETKNPIKMMRGIVGFMRPKFMEGLGGMELALEGADVAVLNPLTNFGGFDVCEKLGVAPIFTFLQPTMPMRESEGSFFPEWPFSVGRERYNMLTHHVAIQVMWQLIRPMLNHARVHQLGLKKHPTVGIWKEIQNRKLPTMLGYSPSVLPPSVDWHDAVHVPGYWFLDEPNQWSPPPELEAFLADGEPPIYIGFGSMTNRDPERSTQIMIDALVQSGERGLLLTGWGGLKDVDLPENIIRVASCPHSWLFPRMKAIVHHGGAGTTAAALRAGKPQIVVPFFADQPYWGRLTQKLGVGVGPLPNKEISAESLSAAILRVSSDRAMQKNAAQLGKRIRAEDGVGNAVAIVEQVLAGRSV